MIDLYRGMKSRPSKTHFSLMDLKTLMFAGSTSYIVNGHSKHKLSRLLDYQKRFDIPYDLYLRDLIRFSQLNAFVIFPFVSTVSHFADSSTINLGGEKHPDKTWNQFRRLMWIGCDLDSQRQVIEEKFATLCDGATRSFAMILGVALDADFK